MRPIYLFCRITTILHKAGETQSQKARDSPLARAESITEPIMAIRPVRLGLPKGASVGDILHQRQDDFIATMPFEDDDFLAVMDLLRREGRLAGDDRLTFS